MKTVVACYIRKADGLAGHPNYVVSHRADYNSSKTGETFGSFVNNLRGNFEQEGIRTKLTDMVVGKYAVLYVSDVLSQEELVQAAMQHGRSL